MKLIQFSCKAALEKTIVSLFNSVQVFVSRFCDKIWIPAPYNIFPYVSNSSHICHGHVTSSGWNMWGSLHYWSLHQWSKTTIFNRCFFPLYFLMYYLSYDFWVINTTPFCQEHNTLCLCWRQISAWHSLYITAINWD